MSDIFDTIITYYDNSHRDPHDRELSWDHCYRFFQTKPIDCKLASLHLGFYLASWGMYRGSGFLLDKDYLVHMCAVTELLKGEYAELNNLNFDRVDKTITLLFSLAEKIKRSYKDNEATETLVTKILLGTLACVPAYDGLLKSGLRQKNIQQAFSENGFRKLIGFCLSHSDEFEKARRYISNESNEFEYPMMKVVDMYFWSKGGGH
jgi:hypothetical protein